MDKLNLALAEIKPKRDGSLSATLVENVTRAALSSKLMDSSPAVANAFTEFAMNAPEDQKLNYLYCIDATLRAEKKKAKREIAAEITEAIALAISSQIKDICKFACNDEGRKKQVTKILNKWREHHIFTHAIVQSCADACGIFLEPVKAKPTEEKKPVPLSVQPSTAPPSSSNTINNNNNVSLSTNTNAPAVAFPLQATTTAESNLLFAINYNKVKAEGNQAFFGNNNPNSSPRGGGSNFYNQQQQQQPTHNNNNNNNNNVYANNVRAAMFNNSFNPRNAPFHQAQQNSSAYQQPPFQPRNPMANPPGGEFNGNYNNNSNFFPPNQHGYGRQHGFPASFPARPMAPRMPTGPRPNVMQQQPSQGNFAAANEAPSNPTGGGNTGNRWGKVAIAIDTDNITPAINSAAGGSAQGWGKVNQVVDAEAGNDPASKKPKLE